MHFLIITEEITSEDPYSEEAASADIEADARAKTAFSSELIIFR